MCMARKERISDLGFYHIVNRGVERRDVFLAAEDYAYFLDLLSEMKKNVQHHHPHLLPDDKPLSCRTRNHTAKYFSSNKIFKLFLLYLFQ